ncbi:hypothetical protein GOODEAATRI_011433 [Goodea atripinnis]|uniref:Uncharacterized protein n=1 Tax=Goodea atripinnis TaxID=208336 RepID=A0ABV0NJC5_9TELE
MDFSFSFMQGIMGNTIQQPPQLIDSANIRQDGSCDTGSDPGEDSGPSYDAALDAEFSYPPSASEDMPQVSNGYPPGLGLYEPQAKFSMYSQFPNGSANGYGAIRSYGEHGLLPGEGTVLRGPGLHERPLSPKESQKNEVTQVQRRHERKKEKRKKSARLQIQVQHQQTVERSQEEAGTTAQTEDAHVTKVHHPSVIQETGFCKEFVIGDLVWSKRERTQWEVGVGHAEDAFLMTRQERIDNYTFIYVDPEPDEAPPTKKPSIRAEKRNRRSSGSVGKKEDVRVKSPDREQPPRRQLPRRQCSVSNTEDSTNSQPAGEEKNQKGEQQKKSSPKPNASSDAKQDSPPPPVRPWKTAAARKLLPLSITMKRLNVEITKCDWPLLQKNITPSPKKDKEEEKKERVEREARQPDLGYCSPDVGLTECRWMVEISRKV